MAVSVVIVWYNESVGKVMTNKRPTKPFLALKIIVIAGWIVLFGLLLKRDYMVESLDVKEGQALARGSEESFLGVYFKNERIGYVQNRFVVSESGDIHLNQKAYLLLNILNDYQPVSLSGQAVLSKDSLLQDFSFQLEAPFYTMRVKGKVRQNLVTLTMNTGKQEIHEEIQLQNPPFISTNRRAYLLGQNITVDSKVKVPYFDPFTLSVQDTVVQYKGKEKTLVKGIVHNLHHFIETHAGIRVNSWLNDKGDVVKEESPAGFVLIAEPEFKAKDISQTSGEILSTVAVPLQGNGLDKFSGVTGLNEMRYRLDLPEGAEFDLNKDRQTFMEDILSLRLESVPTVGDGSLVCAGEDETLAATPYVQVNDQEIEQLVKSLDLSGLEAWERVKVLAEWVYENVEKRPVLGIPDAVTTLANRRGDCNEHASLFAALARNAKIPTRIAAGVTLHKGAFYYHAWNEVCLAGSWITLDTTNNQIPADLGHIKFVEGESIEQARIGALLGQLKIEALE